MVSCRQYLPVFKSADSVYRCLNLQTVFTGVYKLQAVFTGVYKLQAVFTGVYKLQAVFTGV